MTDPHRTTSSTPAPPSAPSPSGSGSSSGLYSTGDLHDEPGASAGHVEVFCPECQTGLRVRAKYLGRHVRCGGCHAKFLVPPSSSAEDVDPPPAAVTPDPDDPWQGRAEVLRLLGEVQALRGQVAALQGEVDRLTRERDEAVTLLERRLGRFVPDFGEGPIGILKDPSQAQGA